MFSSKFLLFILSLLAFGIGAWLAHSGDAQAREFLITSGAGVIGALLRDLQHENPPAAEPKKE